LINNFLYFPTQIALSLHNPCRWATSLLNLLSSTVRGLEKAVAFRKEREDFLKPDA